MKQRALPGEIAKDRDGCVEVVALRIPAVTLRETVPSVNSRKAAFISGLRAHLGLSAPGPPFGSGDPAVAITDAAGRAKNRE